jgi:DNA (cytosine-5)-methyltransferase 1
MPVKPAEFGYADLRKLTGLSPELLALELGISTRTIRRWDSGEIEPKKMVLDRIRSLIRRTGLTSQVEVLENRPSFRFIDLFAGIGGTRIPFQELGGKCVFTSEWDKFSQKTYAVNFGDIPDGDITKIPSSEIPDHDLLLAGFPCQAFSQAGLRQGFKDTRGTMFFEIQRILTHHRPKAFLLENVKQLRGHDKGKTLETILGILRGQHDTGISKNLILSKEARESLETKLNYWVDFKILAAKDFGVPQNRQRIYMIGFDKNAFPEGTDFEKLFVWPVPTGQKTNLGKILERSSSLDDRYTISNKLWAGHKRRKREHHEKGNGFGYSLFNKSSTYANTLSARYYKDGSEILIDQSEIGKNPRKLTPRECARLQGFPEDYIVDAVSDAQAYRQFGNSVCVPVIRQIAKAMVDVLVITVSAEQKLEKKTRYA